MSRSIGTRPTKGKTEGPPPPVSRRPPAVSIEESSDDDSDDGFATFQIADVSPRSNTRTTAIRPVNPNVILKSTTAPKPLISGSSVGVITGIKKVQGKIVNVPREITTRDVEMLNSRARIYFGNRNNINYSPELGLQFNLRGLNDSVPASVSTIVRNILERITPYSPYIIYEYRPMLGCTTLALLESSMVSAVHTFEVNPDYTPMLINNVAKYELSHKHVVEAGPFSLKETKKNVGSMVYFNLSSVEEKINGKSLQEWFVALSKFIAAIAVRVPTAQEIFPSGKGQEKNWGGYRFSLRNPVQEGYATANIFIYVSVEAAERGLEKHPATVHNDEEWTEIVRGFVQKKLTDAGINKSTVKKYTSDDVIDIWKETFTSLPVDRLHNYESKESLGDVALNMSFVRYLFSLYPDITDAQISQLKTRYMSKNKQPDFARSEGYTLPGLVRTFDGRVSDKLLEDVFEAFYGALFQVGMKVGGTSGAGYDLVERYLFYFLDSLPYKIELVTEVETGSEAISAIKVIFDKLGEPTKKFDMDYLRDVVSKDKMYNNLSVVLTPQIIEKIRQNGGPEISDRERVLATGIYFQGESKDQAKLAVYLTAYKKLVSMGVTLEFANQAKYRRDFLHKDLVQYADQIKQKANSEGFDRYRIVDLDPAAIIKTYQLVGTNEQGQDVTLATETGVIPVAAKRSLLEKYLATKKKPRSPKK